MKGYVSPERLGRLLQTASRKHGIEPCQIVGDARHRSVCHARLDIIRALHADGFSNPAIGRALHRDPSTIHHWLRKDTM